MPVAQIITGQESTVDTNPPIHSLIAFYKAFNAREADEAAFTWAKQYAVTMVNPLGGTLRNWNAIREWYGKIMDAEVRFYLEYHDYKIHQSDDVFYVDGRERGSLQMPEYELGLKLRTSRIFKLFGNEWKQVHQHSSIDSAELLQRYQQVTSNFI